MNDKISKNSFCTYKVLILECSLIRHRPRAMHQMWVQLNVDAKKYTTIQVYEKFAASERVGKMQEQQLEREGD